MNISGVGGDRVDESILDTVEIGRLLFINGRGRFEKDFDVGEEAFLALIKTEEEERGKQGKWVNI